MKMTKSQIAVLLKNGWNSEDKRHVELRKDGLVYVSKSLRFRIGRHGTISIQASNDSWISLKTDKYK